jgi:hypothetical protein
LFCEEAFSVKKPLAEKKPLAKKALSCLKKAFSGLKRKPLAEKSP